MKPTRQVECVELMVAANNVTISYAEALLVATPASRLSEMSNLQGQYKHVEQTYGQDVLNLVLAKGYLTRLLENQSARQYLQQHQSDLLMEFQAIVDTVSLDQQQFAATAQMQGRTRICTPNEQGVMR